MASSSVDRRLGLTGDKGMKAPVDCATTGNITLSGEQTIDGVLTSASRVLVKNQTDTTTNGVYDSSSAAWTRAIDFNGNLDIVKGTMVIIASGGQAGLFYQVASSNPITIGTSAITFTVSFTASGTSLSVIRSEASAVGRSIQAKTREIPSLLDWNGVTGDGSHDDTTGIIAAITEFAASGGGDILAPASFKISSLITIPGKVRIVGNGSGSVSQPTVAAASSFLWYGGATAMVKFGGQVATVSGGGMSGIRLDGRALATECIFGKDFQHATFDDLLLTGATANALELTNTDGLDPTGFNVFFRNVKIQLRGGSTSSANGIYINGVGTGASGVTKAVFVSPRIEHANGHGLLINLRGDSNTFEDFYAFRANTTETGYGIYFQSTSAAAVNTTDKFIGSTVAVGGCNLSLPSGVTAAIGIEGTSFESFNTTELASDLTDRFNPFTSLGKILGSGRTDKRYRTGFNRLMHEHQGHSFDDFRFVLYTYPTLFTNQGNWFVVRNGAGGSIASALQPGGAVDLITATGGTDDIAIYSAADFTSGITLSSNPVMQLEAAPASVLTVRDQWGMFGDATLPDPTNGVYIQFDPAVNANYQLIARKAGASTTITTTIAGAASKRQWVICLDSTVNAVYFTKLPTETQWTYLGTNASNIPTVNVLAGFRCRAQAAANRDCHIYSCELGHDHE